MTVKEMRKKLETVLEDTINKELMSEIGELVAKTVKDRTRDGFGVSENYENKKALKPLTAATKRIRTGVQKKGQLSSQTTPETSNLTRSGRMLNNIGYNASDKEVIILPKGKEQLKARDVSKDRPFMNLSKQEINTVIKLIKNKINIGIKKIGL